MSRVIEPSDKLLDLIYDAATEPEMWTSALIQIADMTGNLGGFVVGVEIKDRSVPFLFNAPMSQESHRTYAERHIENPWSPVMNHVPSGKIVQSAEIISLPDLKQAAFFDEVLRPQKMAHNAMLTLARKDDFFGVFNMCRSEAQGPFEEDALRLFSPLYPHLRRALQLGFRLDAYKAMQRAQFDVLDRLSVGIILLDRAAKVVFANAAARAMSADDGVLRLQNSAVTTATAPHGQQLEQLIQAAMRHLPVGTMSIPRPRDGRLVAIVASSIRGKDIDRFSGIGMRDIAAMLFISDPARPPDIPAQWIMDVYGLTLAEARVALCAASGSSIAEVAHNLNVSSNTVKTHLRQIVLQDRCKQTGRTGRPYREAHAG